MIKEEVVPITSGNMILIDLLVDGIYGSPWAWNGGLDHIIKSYPGFDLIYEREYPTIESK